MNAKKMLLGLLPWVVFSVLTQRAGASAVGIAAVAAVALSAYFMATDGKGHRLKIIPVTGVIGFGVIAVLAFSGGQGMSEWLADYGRGASALMLSAVMLISVITVPFSEQYARESVPKAYWSSPIFHAVNQKISALWGGAVLLMGCGHLLAGALDEAAINAGSSARPTDLLLNWLLPIGLVLLGVKGTKALAESAGTTRSATPAAVIR